MEIQGFLLTAVIHLEQCIQSSAITAIPMYSTQLWESPGLDSEHFWAQQWYQHSGMYVIILLLQYGNHIHWKIVSELETHSSTFISEMWCWWWWWLLYLRAGASGAVEWSCASSRCASCSAEANSAELRRDNHGTILSTAHEGPTISWHLLTSGSGPHNTGSQLTLMNCNIVQF